MNENESRTDRHRRGMRIAGVTIAVCGGDAYRRRSRGNATFLGIHRGGCGTCGRRGSCGPELGAAVTNRDAILKRLRALLSLTVENGATEAEAMVAAEKAARLMAEHRLTYTSVAEIESEAFATDRRQWGRKAGAGSRRPPRRHPVQIVLPAIDLLCGTRHIYWPWTGELGFFGPSHATEVAHYLVVIVSRAMDREWCRYRSTLHTAEQVRRHRSTFYNAMGIRIARRIADMTAADRQPSGTTGTALVAVHDEVLDRRFRDAHPDLRESNPKPTLTVVGAIIAGRAAGDSVDINRGLSEATGSGTRMIAAATGDRP